MASILIVEDEVDLCNLIRTQLEGDGHTVFQAFDGQTALELVERQAPQLIILDWMLPGLDGLAVCRQVRQHHLTPILMLTARSDEIDRVLGLEVGADDYGFDRTVDTHIVRLRKKLGGDGERIATVWGVGYRFTA